MIKILYSYSRKWLFYIVSFLLLFTAVLLISQFHHEKKFRIEALNNSLDNYTVLINNYIKHHRFARESDYKKLDTLNTLISRKALRITVIENQGKVLYDSWVKNSDTMENHLMRPEVQESLIKPFGTDIRMSHTTHYRYYYFARKFDNLFVRVSEVYDFNARRFIQPDRAFILFILFLFFITSFTLIIINDNFGQSLKVLRQFTMKALADQPIESDIPFPANELGAIGKDIIAIYNRLNKTKEELMTEKSKLIRHLNMLNEGIAIFSKDKRLITSNARFLEYLNMISDRHIISGEELFTMDDFSSLSGFVYRHLNDEKTEFSKSYPTYEITINRNGKVFSARSVIFQDRSFEISLLDITKPAKRKKLKHELTENIAHELKTPVSSIKGLLETILNGNTDKAKTADFLQRAYAQSCRLADLINDISLLTKMEEASNLYNVEMVDVYDLVMDVAQELEPSLAENNISMEMNVPEHLKVMGNPVLLYSVFRNLFDNSIRHAGQHITIRLDQYLDDKEHYYFSYSDTGKGVPAEALPRLFERFYRVEQGRDRKSGGTGLGLAIVKNAVQFHKGDISARNRAGGGLEFLFTLGKN